MTAALRGNIGRLVLLASLCLNVLLAVYIGTQWLKSARAAYITAAPPRLMELVASRLPAADAAILWDTYKTKEEAFKTAQAAYQAALREAGKTLSEPQLDAAAFRARVMDARDKRLAVGELALETFVEAMPKVSAEGRRGLVRNMRKE